LKRRKAVAREGVRRHKQSGSRREQCWEGQFLTKKTKNGIC